MQWPSPSSAPGILHTLPPNLCAFEPSKPHSSSAINSAPSNTILWIGGQFDTLGSTSYPGILAQHLPPSWTLIQASLSSTGMGWGISSVSREAADIAKLVSYIRSLPSRSEGKIVLMGHSTGCQDAMEYVVGPIDYSGEQGAAATTSTSDRRSSSGSLSAGAKEKPVVNGIILQAPVSDREALAHALPAEQLAKANALARQMCDEGRERDALPYALTKGVFGRLAITARRWMDIASPAPEHQGAEDFFSSDLSAERLRGTFGKLPASVPLLVLFSGAEENLPDGLDKAGVVRRWVETVKATGGAVDEEGSGLVEGASHNLNGQEETAVMDLVARVKGFVDGIEKGSLQKGSKGSNL